MFRNLKKKVLIFCQKGVSRSSTFALAYIMWRNGWGVDEAVTMARKRRGIVSPNPGFLCQLFEWQRLLESAPKPSVISPPAPPGQDEAERKSGTPVPMFKRKSKRELLGSQDVSFASEEATKIVKGWPLAATIVKLRKPMLVSGGRLEALLLRPPIPSMGSVSPLRLGSTSSQPSSTASSSKASGKHPKFFAEGKQEEQHDVTDVGDVDFEAEDDGTEAAESKSVTPWEHNSARAAQIDWGVVLIRRASDRSLWLPRTIDELLVDPQMGADGEALQGHTEEGKLARKGSKPEWNVPYARHLMLFAPFQCLLFPHTRTTKEHQAIAFAGLAEIARWAKLQLLSAAAWKNALTIDNEDSRVLLSHTLVSPPAKPEEPRSVSTEESMREELVMKLISSVLNRPFEESHTDTVAQILSGSEKAEKESKKQNAALHMKPVRERRREPEADAAQTLKDKVKAIEHKLHDTQGVDEEAKSAPSQRKPLAAVAKGVATEQQKKEALAADGTPLLKRGDIDPEELEREAKERELKDQHPLGYTFAAPMLFEVSPAGAKAIKDSLISSESSSKLSANDFTHLSVYDDEDLDSEGNISGLPTVTPTRYNLSLLFSCCLRAFLWLRRCVRVSSRRRQKAFVEGICMDWL